MEARIKRLFHRKKDTSSETPLHQSQRSNAAQSSPALRTSLYDSVPAGGPPQTGSYPIKGENTAVALQKRNSIRHKRGPSDPIHGPFNSPAPNYSQQRPKSTNAGPTSSQRDYTSSADEINRPFTGTPEGNRREQKKLPEPPLPTPNDFAALRLEPKTSLSNPSQAKKSYDGPTPPFNQVYRGDQGNSDVPTNPSNRVEFPYPGNAIMEDRNGSSVDVGELSRKKSIPRKEIGTYSKDSESKKLSSTPFEQTKLKTSIRSPIPSSGVFGGSRSQNDEIGQRSNDTAKLGAGLRGSRANTAEQVLANAQNNSVDTEIAGAWAPAVVHETVHQKIHHVREEHITREIHNHDVFHRILPIIDVEVLPTRHFLPVEGGGLVEISGDEAPGRGRNWVIAETASKIPSDQAAPKGVSRFSARDFPGTEGDSRTYISSEGIKTTEETWVHPPELETGGRDAGQTWPMVFGEHGDSKIGKKKNTKETSISRPKPADRH